MPLSIIHLASGTLESRLLTSPYTDKFLTLKFYLSSDLQNLLKPIYQEQCLSTERQNIIHKAFKVLKTKPKEAHLGKVFSFFKMRDGAQMKHTMVNRNCAPLQSCTIAIKP